jgi:tRNA A-37 threonylcarbamoyl transferase component Bud32
MVGPQQARQPAQTRYREVCPLASGGMAELSLAKMIGVGGFERLVVIKRVKPQLAGAPDLAQALLDEARIAATLQHGNIVQVHDVTFEDGLVSVVMEYLHGQDVRTLMRRSEAVGEAVLPLDSAIQIAVGVCAGLHHAHERVDAQGKPLDIVHRDVSADNVVITYDGGIKLIDFGIARAHSRLGQTDHGVTKGKPGYMAPEQILCTHLDRRTDVHAAAVLLYEMTTGVQPRTGASSDYELLNWTVERDATPPSSVRPGYPEELEAIVLRGLAREPAARYQSALEMQRDLEAFAREHKLDLSSFALARVMETFFRDKLSAWREAQRAGTSLADHVAAVRRSTVGQGGGDEVRAAVAQQLAATELTPARPRGRSAVAYALLGVMAVVAIGIGVWRAGADDRAPPPPTEVDTKPVPVPVPVPLPDPDPGTGTGTEPEDDLVVVEPTAPDAAPAKKSADRRDTTPRSAIRHSSKSKSKGGKDKRKGTVNEPTAADTKPKDADAAVDKPAPPVDKPPVTPPRPVDPDGSLPR